MVTYINYFIQFYSEGITCHVFNYIACVLFLITSIKSIYDLIVTEFIYGEERWTKMTLRKLFHLLLPISEITYCVCLVVYGYFCVEIKEQLLNDTIWTSIGGYVLVLCFLINAVHWFLLASQPSALRNGIIFSIIAVFFVIIPFIMLVFIAIFFYTDPNMKDIIHYIELVYAAVLNFIVAFITSITWFVLDRRLKGLGEIYMIKVLRKQLKIQMSLNMMFFFIRAVCLLILGPFGGFLDHKEKFNKSDTLRNQIIYFISAILGDIPLAFTMLHFLALKKKPTDTSATAGVGEADNGVVRRYQAESYVGFNETHPITYLAMQPGQTTHGNMPPLGTNGMSSSTNSSYDSIAGQV